eukprot:COSAG01_NODE_5407_length_4281_cov_1.613196_4_plen_101_part_00
MKARKNERGQRFFSHYHADTNGIMLDLHVALRGVGQEEEEGSGAAAIVGGGFSCHPRPRPRPTRHSSCYGPSRLHCLHNGRADTRIGLELPAWPSYVSPD